MNTTEQEINQKIRDEMTQIQADLERAFSMLFQQAGNKIKPEKQEKVQKEIESTKQLLERFKSKYA
jgi:ElaB/YqjD/DUF883 family membrane-anchored ribosome-binding protein